LHNPKFAFTDLQKYLHAIDDLAQHATDGQRIEITRELVDLTSEILSYTERSPHDELAEPSDPNARLSLEKIRILKQKASISRSCLQGKTTAEIAKLHSVVKQSVQLHLTEILRVLRKRTRVASKFMGKADPLVDLSGQLSQLTTEERTTYLAALARFELELERREHGRPWGDVWQ
jgi:hypothetical protein